MKNYIEFIDYNSEKFEIVRSIRTAVFTNEQGANADEEFDAYDKNAIFLLLYEGDNPVGTARTVSYNDGFKIGRIAILREHRGKGYGAAVVRAACDRAIQLDDAPIYVDAQNYAVPFYERLGFEVIGEELIDRGLPHIPMRLDKESYYEK